MTWLFFVLFLLLFLSLVGYVRWRIAHTNVLPKQLKRAWNLGLWILPFALLALGILSRWSYWPLWFTISSALWFALLLSVCLMALVLGAEDLLRGLRMGVSKLRGFLLRLFKVQQLSKVNGPSPGMSRSTFLVKSSLLLGTLPYASVGYGVLIGAYDYQVHRHRLYLPSLPRAFDGLRIAQVSDIHAGSFWQKSPLQDGIDQLLAEKPDVIFFTGDIVNGITREMKDYVSLFSQLKAPLGTFSVLGNHDYGDYHKWSSPREKSQNLLDMYQLHKALGWQLLLNEHTEIRADQESLAIIGVENWGSGRFAKYGDIQKAVKGVEAPCRILLSHDPSHWEAQVWDFSPSIALTCSGHTHGFQLGIEAGALRWSPAQYIYKHWGGLYQRGEQYLYVNRGFGFVGFPGRLGIAPEITLLELHKGNPIN